MRLSRWLPLLALAFPATAHAAPAIWQVSDADSKVWLFGSIHVLPDTVAWRTPAFDAIFKDAEQVYFEADIGPLGQLGLVVASLRNAFGEHVPWLPNLTPEQTASLTAAIAPLGLTTDQLAAFDPWLAEAVIEDKVMTRLGYDAAHGVDSTLQAELPKEKKAYFETATEQMDMLAAEPQERQIARLMAAVADIGNIPAELTAMAAAWQDGNPEALATQLAADPTMDASFAQTMVLDRNARWATTIGRLLADNHQDLIVVGAGHLVGPGGLPDLLSKAGFTVQRIQ